MTIRVVARIEAQPDKVAEVRELLVSLVEPTRQETGCITYELRCKQPEGLQESSRWSERSGDHRKKIKIGFSPRRGARCKTLS